MPNNENNNFSNNFNQLNGQVPNNMEQPVAEPVQPAEPTAPVQPVQTVEPVPQPAPQRQFIEIPQEYYDKLAQEKAEEEAAKEAAPAAPAPTTMSTDGSVVKSFIPFSIVTALVVFAVFYLTVNVNELISAGLLVYVIVFSAIFAIKDKKESGFPISVIVGGMLSAVVCFIISMTTEEMDLWTYYTIASAITGFLGLIVSSIITKLLTDIKNVKALQTILYLLFFVALIGGPILAYKKYPTEFYKYVFYKKSEVVANTYEEFVLKTLKSRYNITFTCDFAKKEHYKTERNELMVHMTCSDENNNQVNVKTIAYNEGSNQYTVIDDFIETLYLKDIKTQISQKIQSVTGATEVIVYLFPKENCTFIGDCVDCEEYYKVYKKENDPDNRYKVSSALDLSQYINLTNKDFIKKFINTNNYKVIVNIRGKFHKETFDFSSSVEMVLAELNNTDLINSFGYELRYSNYEKDMHEIIVHEAKGTTTANKKFE